MAAAGRELDEEEAAHRNEVLLVGRVAAAAEERELPSGDLLAVFRLVVERPPGPATAKAGRAGGVDTLDCAAWGAGVRRTARALGPGDVVEVHGALRRRFWRAGAGAVSRTEIEVAALRRLARAAPRPTPGRAARQERRATPQERRAARQERQATPQERQAPPREGRATAQERQAS